MIRPTHAWNSLGIQLATTVVRWLKPDLIHIQDQIHSYFETDAAIQIAKAANCPVVITLHEFHDELASVRHTIQLVSRADKVITSDARTSDRCRNYTGRNPDWQGWSPANVLPLDLDQAVKPIAGLFTTFGLISPIKQLPLIFEALRDLRQQGVDVQWRIVGPFDPINNAYHAELQERFRVPWVQFTGGFPNMQDRRLRSLLAESDVMILPFADGASLRRTSLHTAWAFGLPVITTAPFESEPSIQDEVNCLTVKESSSEAWVEAIARLLQDAKLKEQLCAGSRAAAQQFSWTRLADLHKEIYQQLLN